MKKRMLIALLVGGAVFGAAIGLAASLDVSSRSLGAGDAVVASCDTNGIQTSFGLTYNNTTTQYVVTNVNLNGVSGACSQKTIQIALTDGGVKIGETFQVAPNLPDPAQSYSFSVPMAAPHAAASDVDDIHVVIGG
jgi:hypothetical protein